MRGPLLLTCVASCLSALPAWAQAPRVTPAYELLAARPAVSVEPGAVHAFSDIRAAVAAKDTARLGALLAADFKPLACSSDPTAPCGPGRVASVRGGKTPLDRLRLVLCCGGRDDPAVSPVARDEALFGVVDSLLASGAPARGAEFGDVVCMPAIPTIDRAKVKALSKRLDIEPTSFRLAAAPIEARPRAERAAPVIATLPTGAVVPLLTATGTPLPDGWTALALPGGGVGYAEGVTLDELAPESICVRPGKDGWRLAFLIGRQS